MQRRRLRGPDAVRLRVHVVRRARRHRGGGRPGRCGFRVLLPARGARVASPPSAGACRARAARSAGRPSRRTTASPTSPTSATARSRATRSATTAHLSLLEPVAATTVDGQKGIRDEAFSSDGQYLYALHADVQKVFGWSVAGDGSLEPIGSFGDLPETVAGLAVI